MLYYLLLLPHYIISLLIDNDTKTKLYLDALGYLKLNNKCEIKSSLSFRALVKLLRKEKEFRSIYYWRVAKVSHKYHLLGTLQFLLPPVTLLGFGIPSEHVGAGLFVQHGNSTIIHAKRIGDNFFVNQNVTIGNSGKGIPVIGDNVRVCTGAVVLGPISIGNNVIIGANATVVKDVPDNCTVIPSASTS